MNCGKLVDVYINGIKREQQAFIDEDVTLSIMGLLEQEKDPNHSIVGIYNDKENVLDIVRGEDEYSTMYATSALIREYHADLLDAELFGITNTMVMRCFLGFVSKEFEFLRFAKKKEKGFGLVKRDR